MSISLLEIEDLAIAILDLDENTTDSDVIEDAVYSKFEISMEQFSAIVEALIPFTIPAKTALSNAMWQGFVIPKDNCFIVKQKVN